MKLYVGTYAKYNEGSLGGAWLDLDKYANADEFEAACRKLHSDERDPEFMFQDVETDPGCDWQEGLYSESSIPREYWSLKAEFSAKDGAKRAAKPSPEKAEQEKLMVKYMSYRRRTREADEKQFLEWAKYYRGRYHFVELTDGVVVCIGKPAIETRFCCGENDCGQGGDGPGTMAFANKVLESKRTESGFKAANLDPFDREMVHLVGRKAWRFARSGGKGAETWCGDFVPCVMTGAYVDGAKYLGNAANPAGTEKVVRILNDDDMRRLRRGYMVVRTAFKKRLNAYWKRFGASKIKTWTYWTEA